MRIAIYYPWVYTKGGAERVFLQIAQALSKDNEVTLFTGHYSPADTFEEFKNFDVRVIKPGLRINNFFTRAVSSVLHYAFGKINMKDYDAFIVCTGGLGELILLRNHKKPSFIYCYTPLRVAHQFYDYYMKKFSLPKKIMLWFGVKVYRLLERIAWKKACYAMHDSKNTENNVLAAKLIDASRSEVVYPGVDLHNFKPSSTNKKYFLATGRFKPYKRFELAVEAFKELKKTTKGYKLIIAGSVSEEKYLDRIKALASDTKDIELRINVSEKELTKLYKESFAYLFTAENEDFGIVPIEAMACGKPVIGVNEGGVKETVVNGKTGFLVDADAKEFSEKMGLLIKNKKTYKRMCKAAAKRAQEFDLNGFNKRIKDIIYTKG